MTRRAISPPPRAAAATMIGVASGHYHADELRTAQADHVLRSLTDPFPGL